MLQSNEEKVMLNQLYNICLKTAKDIVKAYNEAHYNVNLRCDIADVGSSGGEGTNQVIYGTTAGIPATVSGITSAAPTYATQEVSINKALMPALEDLQAAMYGQYGPQLQQIASDIVSQAQQAQVASDTGLLSGQGQDLLSNLVASDQILQPEWYTQRTNVANQLGNLVNSINVGGLTDAEREEVNRAVNQQNISRGNLISPSTTSAVESAMQFPDKLATKRAELTNILNTASGVLPNLGSKYNAYDIGTGKAAEAPLADTKFGGVTDFQFDMSELSDLAKAQLGAATATSTTAQSKTQDLGSLAWSHFDPCGD